MSVSVEDLAHHSGVSLDYLENQISDQHVLDFAKYCSPFEEIGPHLGLSQKTLEDIQREKRTEELRRRETLKRWKDEFAIKATYRKLIQSLLACQKASSASEICSALKEEESPPAKPEKPSIDLATRGSQPPKQVLETATLTTTTCV